MNDADKMNEHESVNRTFSNPSQVDTLETNFKCEKCDFETNRKSYMIKHKKETHKWCTSFASIEKLKEHYIQGDGVSDKIVHSIFLIF